MQCVRALAVGAIVVTATMAAACGSDATGEQSATTAVANEPPLTTTTAADPPTTAVVVDEPGPGIDYASQYLDVVAPANCAVQVLARAGEALVGDAAFFVDDWPRIHDELLPLYAGHADALDELSERLRAADWPDELGDDFDLVISDVSVHAQWSREVSEATDWDSFSNSMASTPEPSEAAMAVRTQLGLDPKLFDPTVDDVDWCNDPPR